MRLAWFAPMPPRDESSSADLSADALPLLAEHHRIDVFAGTPAASTAWADWCVPVLNPYDFVWRARQQPYDLIVYQLSNAPRHDYVWGYLWNFPGLVVLQDGHLHHARARILLDRLEPRLDDYGAELHDNHGIDPDVRRALATFTGPALHVWPMRRAVVRGARAVAAHTAILADELRRECPDTLVGMIRPGVADPGLHADLRRTEGAHRVRHNLGCGPQTVVVAVFGALTCSRRIPVILDALSSLGTTHPDLRLMLAGPETDECDVMADARARHLADRVFVTGPIPARDLPAHLGAADFAVSLVWPTAAETPGIWLQCLASGLPTIVTDTEHHADLPLADPRTWSVVSAAHGAAAPEPVAVLVDLLAERQTLQLAIGRLASDAARRRRIGEAARAWWAARHTPRVMADDYLEIIEQTARRPAPDIALPKHLRPDVFEHTRDLLEGAGARLPPELTPAVTRTPGAREYNS
jgi:glycosyltransferase involved in cell wall biosynthesis